MKIRIDNLIFNGANQIVNRDGEYVIEPSLARGYPLEFKIVIEDCDTAPYAVQVNFFDQSISVHGVKQALYPNSPNPVGTLTCTVLVSFPLVLRCY